MPNISIVIPVHNDGVKLEKCIRSLFAQTYPKEKLPVRATGWEDLRKNLMEGLFKRIRLIPVSEFKNGYALGQLYHFDEKSVR
jgi:GT2 family glycosyltransferase